MSYAIIESYNNSTATVRIGGLEHPARNYDCFRLYLDGTKMGWRDPTSSSSSGEAYIEFDLTQTADGRTTADGSYSAKVYAVWNGREYNVPISNSSWIKIDKGGGSSPDPTPSEHELTYIKILRFLSVEDGYVKVEIETDGYGTVDLVSVTKGWNLTNGGRDSSYVYVAHDYIEKYHLTNGRFQGTVSYSFNETDLSYFPSVPVGTCHLAGGGGLNDYGTFSKAFICMSQYNNWTTYDGTYSTTLKYDNGKMYAGVDYLSTVRSDWMRLVNMSFYLDATAYGTIKYSQYSNYIPRYGDIITAWMYNALVDSVRDCCRHLGFNYYDMPAYVSSGDIIPSNFIKKLGLVVDNALITQRMRTNDAVIRGY